MEGEGNFFKKIRAVLGRRREENEGRKVDSGRESFKFDQRFISRLEESSNPTIKALGYAIEKAVRDAIDSYRREQQTHRGSAETPEHWAGIKRVTAIGPGYDLNALAKDGPRRFGPAWGEEDVVKLLREFGINPEGKTPTEQLEWVRKRYYSEHSVFTAYPNNPDWRICVPYSTYFIPVSSGDVQLLIHFTRNLKPDEKLFYPRQPSLFAGLPLGVGVRIGGSTLGSLMQQMMQKR